jgi:hypothetical protein
MNKLTIPLSALMYKISFQSTRQADTTAAATVGNNNNNNNNDSGNNKNKNNAYNTRVTSVLPSRVIISPSGIGYWDTFVFFERIESIEMLIENRLPRAFVLFTVNIRAHHCRCVYTRAFVCKRSFLIRPRKRKRFLETDFVRTLKK